MTGLEGLTYLSSALTVLYMLLLLVLVVQPRLRRRTPWPWLIGASLLLAGLNAARAVFGGWGAWVSAGLWVASAVAQYAAWRFVRDVDRRIAALRADAETYIALANRLSTRRSPVRRTLEGPPR